MLHTGHTLSSDVATFFQGRGKVMEDCDVAPLKPRERIISTARGLFRKHGIRGIGVDAIADVAGANKRKLDRCLWWGGEHGGAVPGEWCPGRRGGRGGGCNRPPP